VGLPEQEGPLEAIAKLWADGLRAVILALPEHLKEAVPEQLKLDTAIEGERGEHPAG
jgi:hypothetical protein